MNGYELLAHCSMTPNQRRRHVLGSDAITDKATVKSVQAQLQLIAKNSGNKALDPKLEKNRPPGPDGILGPNTKSAVAAFNSQFGWPDDGSSITKGTLEALARPDVVRLTQGAQASSITFTDETVTARKEVVEQVKQSNDAVQAAADAKAKAVTPAEKQAADAQAKAAQAQADAVAAKATAAPPEVKQAIAQVQVAAKAVDQAQTPQQISAAKEQASAADAKVQNITTAMLWVPIVVGLISLFGLGTAIVLAAKSHWLWAALTFFLITPAVATGAGFASKKITA